MYHPFGDWHQQLEYVVPTQQWEYVVQTLNYIYVGLPDSPGKHQQ